MRIWISLGCIAAFGVGAAAMACSSNSPSEAAPGDVSGAGQDASSGGDSDDSDTSKNGDAIGDAGICKTEKDCHGGAPCLFYEANGCTLEYAGCDRGNHDVDPYLPDGAPPSYRDGAPWCTGSTVACSCTGETFIIPCYFHDGRTPRPLLHRGACTGDELVDAATDAQDASDAGEP